ncbi:MAG: transcription termination/antitermination protein NusA [Bryobacteraceae bacterium]|nr:transcription termination/antitermination protein NusA [Bryobacteraceae bacterium]
MGTISQSIEILSKEKGIDPQIVLDAVKDAMLVAARKHYRTEEDLVAELDDKTGSINIFAIKKVVEHVTDSSRELSLEQARRLSPGAALESEVRIPMNTEALGRISAQTAKQVILQKVREAERETIYSEYSGRVGELVNCVIKRIEGLDMIVDLGKTEARLPKKEQSKAESFAAGERVRCVIRAVEKAGKTAGVTVSRAAPELVMRLFEQEVPEIYDGTVTIKACAREAGERTKIAVWSRDRDVDSVGACVGMRGMRVQSIIRELRGEKIDIIQYSDDPVVFATNALSPAKITRVAIVDSANKHMEVIVDDSQLSLAIGKKGQNVRLGARLLGWRIDIKSEEEKRQEVESEMAALVVPGAPVTVLMDHGLSEKLVEKLAEAGVPTVEKLGSMTPEQLAEISGIGPKMIEKIQAAVVNYYGQFEVAVEEEAESADAATAEASESEALEEPAETGEMDESSYDEPAEAAEPADETAEPVEAAPEEGGESLSGEDSPGTGENPEGEAAIERLDASEPHESGADGQSASDDADTAADRELLENESDTIEETGLTS